MHSPNDMLRVCSLRSWLSLVNNHVKAMVNKVLSDESSSDSSGDIQNSATEISTDSEFAHDDPTPTREIPSIVFNDFNVTKTRGSSSIPKKIQVKTGYLQKPINGKAPKQDIELKLEPLVPSAPIIKKPALRTENYALSRTQSTGGMATKMSLELKRKYLLGEASSGNIQKSGSASTLDTKFKSFVTNISDCQKMLKPASDLSSSMFKLNEPILSPSTSHVSLKQTEPKANEKVEISKEHAPVSGNLPPPDVTEVVNQTTEQVIDSEQPAPTPVFENESEGRPRSPLHETSIIVPKFNWSKKEHSHSDDSLSSMSSGRDQVPNFHFENIPRVEVHTANDDDIPPDSLCLEAELKKSEIPKIDNQSSISSEPPKSITSEKKTLNQPKSLPNLDGMALEIHNSLHHKPASDEIKNESPENEVKSIKNSSGRSSPDSCLEQATAALTETELSDWARDGAVSDDLDEDFEFQRDTENKRGYKKPKELPEDLNRTIAKISEFDDNGHICGKDKKIVETKNEILIDSNVLNADLDNIDFMDTGTETSSDDGTGDGQDGYVRFQNEDETEDSLNPNINEITETKNPCMTDKTDVFPNTGFCYFADNNFGGEVVNLKPSDLEMRKQKQLNTEHEEDSLVIVETGTTTEENTCSDSTVKNVTELSADKIFNYNNKHIDNNNFQKQRLEEKLAKLKAEKALSQNNISEEIKKPVNKEQTLDANVEFVEHCQRLQSKVEFSNVKDSIDIRKSRRKSKSDSPQKPDLIQEEKDKFSPQHVKKDVTLNFTAIRSPDLLYNKQIIEKERDVNQKLVQEMVMNKMRAENKSLERKKRNRTIPSVLSPNRPYELSKSATTDVSQIKNLDKVSNRHSAYSTNANHYVTPDVLLTSNPLPLQRSQTVSSVPLASSKSTGSLATTSNVNTHPLSIHSTSNLTNDSPVKNSSLSLRKSSISDNFKTPKAPPRQKHEEAKRTAEKLKQDARARFRVLSNEELGLSPEDKFNKLKEKASKRGKENEKINPDVEESIESLVKNTEKRNSWLHSNTDLSMKKSNSFKRSNSGESYRTNKLSTFQDPCDKLSTPNRTKSIPEIPKDCLNKKSSNDKTDAMKICKSDPNLLDTDYKKSKKKSKDRDRRKSITKIINFISKKMPSSNNGSKSGIFSRLSPKMKDISKSCANLERRDAETVVEEPLRRKSVSEMSINKKIDDTVPPPVPPLPLNYTGITKYTDDSSDGEHEHNHDRSSCDTLDQSGVLETSVSSLTGRKSSSKSRRASRQAQLKRHRMAQEIQRKLEETEVKTRELEKRGVLIEKALRGENNEDSTKDESELLQEWFDLMRDRTELQRYEKELTIRAQELELEDRHARLQHELRERLENNEKKTQEDIQIEGSIVNEMLQIVAKRDSLITILEDDRLRYSNEDRDFEEQMLAKGLRLTPIRKSPEK